MKLIGLLFISLLVTGCAKTADLVNYSASGSNDTRTKYKSAVLNSGPSYYWRVAQNNSDGLIREIVQGNTGQLRGGYTLSSNGGVFNSSEGSVNFNGTSSYIDLVRQVVMTDSFSIEFWFKTSIAGGSLASFTAISFNRGTTADFQIYMTDGGILYWGLDSGTMVTCSSTNSYSNGAWHQVVAAYGGLTGLILYVDGTSICNQTVSISDFSATGNWEFAGNDLTSWPSRPSSDYYSGLFDEVSIYDSVLPLTTVKAHYATGTGTQ